MSVDIKVAPDDKLQLVQTYFTDNSPSSEFFNITELPDTLSGGKNAFLIAGSDKLFPQSEVKVQVRDAAGNVCYVEYANGNPEYYEGISKVVAVYVYPNETAFGPATITILGQAIDVPDEWKFRFNVKWQTTININPSLPNTTRVRFYKRPKVDIVETLQPIYRIESGSKVESGVTASFADIKISQLETFAGDVKRVKVFRTSEGDISDFDLIQDILIESKELLTTFDISSSVKGNAGIFTNETLKLWNTGSLTASLTNDRLDNGLRLKGSGIFRYTSSLSFSTKSTYEFNLDAFYSSSTNSNLGVYISGSNNGIQLIGTLEGTIPVKNLEDSYFTFDVDKNEPTASLYLSQSQSEWHVANVSLKLSEDSAFSPNQINFISTMPTVIGNETYNFKFEFYDVNNNFVPVAVTQSALFTGGNNNIGGTLILISGSTSASNASILALSQSVSGTIGNVTASVSQSFFTASAFSASLQSSSLFISSSLSSSISSSKGAAISSSFGNIQTLANGNFSGSFISDTTIFAPVIGGNNGYISDLFKVGTAPSIYLDARQNPRKIFIGGVSDSGSYNNSNTTVYMDSGGKFSLGDQLSWNGNALTINGTINVLGGNAATDANALLYAQRAALSGSISASNAQAAASASSYIMATTSANTARDAAILSASGSSFTQANTAYNNAITAASIDATAKSNTAFTNAAAQVKLLADGGYNGVFISSREIFAPVIGGTVGYFSNQFRVGDSGIVLDGVNKRIYIGSGTYNNSNTGFYVDNSGNFSLGNKLSWNNNVLSIEGSINATAGNFTGNITANTGQIGSWIIDGGNLRNGTNQLILDPTAPSIKLRDTNASDKVVFRTGPLSSITTTSISILGDTISIPFTSISTVQNYDTGKVYGASQSLGTIAAGNYEQTITLNPGTGTAIYIPPGVGCYVTVSYGWSIFNSAGVEVDSGGGSGKTRSSFVGNTSPISVPWSSTTYLESLSFPTTDTYSIRSYYEININYTAGTAAVEIRALTTGTAAASFNKINNYTEITEQGIQVVSSVSRYVRMSTNQSTDVDALYVNGSFTATDKNFKITHPLDENKWLLHSSIEGPRVDNLYRGMVTLLNGFAKINLDEISNMTEGTWIKLNREPQFFLQNMNGWDRVKGEIINNELFIYSENSDSTDLISYMVIGERHDDGIKQSGFTNNDGRLITEILK
jgi:hypothetical protein